MQNNRGPITGGISGGIVLIGLALAFAFGGFNLPIFFVALAFAALISSFGSGNPRGAYGGIQGFFWLLMLAIFFATGFHWVWFLVAAGISAILGALAQPILAGLGGMTAFGMTRQQPHYQQPYYQPSQPQQPPYQPYQEGYQPQPETYQEGGQQHQYPPTPQPSQQYEQPQAQYPQEMPPQQ